MYTHQSREAVREFEEMIGNPFKEVGFVAADQTGALPKRTHERPISNRSSHGPATKAGKARLLWPTCTAEDCSTPQCLWSGVPFCYPHSLEEIGEGGMKAAYEATHDISWAEFRKGK